MAERLQKVLAGAGVASRRDAELWIAAGRVTVNGRLATVGLKVEAHDDIAVDGRKLRLDRAAPADLVLIYHRSPGESLKTADAEGDAAAASTYDRLPPVRGRRWLPLSPLAPLDGGLEIFTTDGQLRAAASKRFAEIPCRYAVRVHGEPTDALVESFAAAALAGEPAFEITQAMLLAGAGRNRWIEFEVRRGHGRDLRRIVMDAGLEVGRILRTRFGPVSMDRTVSRGRHRELQGKERDALYQAVGLPPPGVALKPAPAAERARAPLTPRGSRGPVGRGRPR